MCYYTCRHTCNNHIVRHILYHHSIGSYYDVIANLYVANNLGTTANFYIVAYYRSFISMVIANGNLLVDFEISSYSFSIYNSCEAVLD